MMALDYYIADKIKVVIVGSINATDTQVMLDLINNYFLPAAMVTFYNSSEQRDSEYKTINGKATAYICKNFACQPPITDMEKLANELNGRGKQFTQCIITNN